VNGVLLRPLPYPEAERLVMIWEDYQERGGPEREWTNPANFYDWRSQNQVFAEMFALNDWAPTLTGDQEPELLVGSVATYGMFATLGVRPAMGRGFDAREDQPGGDRVVVLSDGLWKRRFGGDPDITGRRLVLSGNSFTVIGVMPPGFRYPVIPNAEIWAPMQAEPTAGRGNAFLRVVGRLREGVTLAGARAEMSAIAARLEKQYPDTNARTGIRLVNLQVDTARPVRAALLVLMGAVGLVLLIACANVANLLIARASARGKEIAIRAALGAGRRRIVRQLLTESVLLSACGGFAGLGLAVWVADLLVTGAPFGLGQTYDIRLDSTVMAFTVLVACGTGVLFGIAPAVAAASGTPGIALKEDAPGASRTHLPVRNAIVVAEMAMSVALLSGAGVLVRSFYELLHAGPGFNPRNVLVAGLNLPQTKYADGAQAAAFYQELLERIRSLPGVRSASAVNNLPLGGNHTDANFIVEGRPVPPPDRMPAAWYTPVSPAYFETMGVQLLRGRALDQRDHAGAPRVIVINESMAKKYWPGEDPVGKRIGTGGDSPQGRLWREVVGVVGNVRAFGLDREEPPTMYLSHAQLPARRMNLVVRTGGDPMDLAAALRSVVRERDRELAISRMATLESILRSSVADRRFLMLLLGGFAAAAMILAAVGLYGVMAYIVTGRTREIGIRMALGAHAGDVFGMVAGQGMRLAAIGIALGIAIAIPALSSLEKLVYGISPRDPATLVAISALLALVAMVACCVPARRAIRLNPTIALRHQ
jgi:putative ABC transport system permease protein